MNMIDLRSPILNRYPTFFLMCLCSPLPLKKYAWLESPGAGTVGVGFPRGGLVEGMGMGVECWFSMSWTPGAGMEYHHD